jgi:hypothetical protein
MLDRLHPLSSACMLFFDVTSCRGTWFLFHRRLSNLAHLFRRHPHAGTMAVLYQIVV